MTWPSLCHLLRSRAQDQPEGHAFCYLTTFHGEEATPGPLLRYGNLDRLARAVAAVLQEHVPAGARALLLYPPGLDFIPAFFACSYARVVAVPVPIPDARRLHRTLARLRVVNADAEPVAALTTLQTMTFLPSLLRQAPELGSLRWIPTDEIEPGEADGWKERTVRDDELAYLQYTSGSTSTPKGVMVSHRNLMANSESIRHAWGYGRGSTAVMWVPSFHDDGLVHGILQPVYAGFPSYLMSPLTAIERPAHWLEAIGRVQATHSGGPNFIYALCAQRIAAEERERLDLASWRVAYNAAEPVHAETLEAFCQAFGPRGFRREAFFPSFGLAEATLLVSTKAGAGSPTLLRVQKAALELAGRAEPAAEGATGTKTIVGCGSPVPGTDVVIADPASGRPCRPDEVGEVWISGPGVAQGYWGHPEATRETFGALLGDGRGPFLRTGDLGFLHAGELYITGRLKDMIIVRGRNHYPQDIELTAGLSRPELRPGCGVAFSLEVDGEEQLVVVHEVKDPAGTDVEAIAEKVCRDVAEAHDLQLYALVLLPPRTVPKTSSGKLQRRACRDELLAGRLPETGGWVLGRPATQGGAETTGEFLRRKISAPAREPVRPPAPVVPAGPAPSGRAAGEASTGEVLSWLRSWAPHGLDSSLIDERRSIPPSVVLELGNHGFFGLQADRALGGLGLSHREAARVLVQLGAVDLTVACLVSGHNSLGLRPLERWAAPGLRDALLPDLVRGRTLAAFALTESGAGSNPRGLATQAVPGGGGWSLRGRKIWIGSAAWAGVIHVFAQVQGDPASRGITAFAVRKGTRGLRVGPEALTMGLRGMVQSAVELQDVPVTGDDLLGSIGEGLEVAEDAISLSRLFLVAVSVGGMRRCAQLMARFASRRDIATGLLLDHPVTRSRLGEVAAATAGVEALLHLLAGRFDAGETVPREILACAKTSAAEHLWQAADHLVQLLGGRGYIETNLAPQILRDARIFRVFEGPSEALLQFVGSSLLQGREQVPEFLRTIPGGTGIARRLLEVAEELRERTPARLEREDRIARLRWTYGLAGELAGSALLLAALEGSSANGSPGIWSRARDWARQRFEEQARRALAGSPQEAAILEASEVRQLLEDVTAAIGEVDPGTAGEDRALDPLLAPGAPAEAAGLRQVEPELPPAPLPAGIPAEAPFEVPIPPLPEPGPGAAAIREWVAAWLAARIGISTEDIDSRKPFTSLGLDSVVGVQMAAELGSWLGQPVDPTLAWDFPTIDSLAAHLGGESDGRAPAASELLPEELELLREIEALSPEEAQVALERALFQNPKEARHG